MEIFIAGRSAEAKLRSSSTPILIILRGCRTLVGLDNGRTAYGNFNENFEYKFKVWSRICNIPDPESPVKIANNGVPKEIIRVWGRN